MTHDLVFTNGRIFARGGTHRADVAVDGDRIAAVGTGLTGRETVDLDGGLLVPGFQDAHVHPIAAGVQVLRCDLTDRRTAGEYLRTVARYAAARPDLQWIVGGGWAMEAFPGGTPTRHALDEIVPDRPVYLPNRDSHGAWVNTRALEVAGIGPHTPDPADGRIEREPDGHPSGTLHEGAADLVGRHVPAATDAELDAGLRAAQERLFSVGVTGWQDAWVGPGLHGHRDLLPVYLRAASSGTLRARVRGALWWERDRGLEQLPELLDRRTAVGRFTARTVKIMQDGVAENFTAAMTAPYRHGHGAGLSFIDPESLKTYVTRLDAEGFQVHVHALGDRAVREALDAIEAARTANGPRGNRHHLAHLQVVHPDDLDRFAALDVTANLQALWACHEPQMDELTIPFLDPVLAARQYPFAALRDAGARLAAGSDWMVSSPDPLAAAHVAVNRTAPDGPAERPFLAHQALTLGEFLTAYTEGSAFVCHRDDETGRIAPGMLADLAVLDRDPFARPAAEIALTRVRRTYVGGEQVFNAG
ncbi:amidohydrolase [Catenuloplanes atrovinosus]|uniref:Amidohydrolase YtcJ n=1 Tax=Catenuloplanes atrovinosus TaxID=137266 RepID=A0AAE3YRC5_9ACTN|nr:amidohydrolase [Catenuloplanes atrovinosus]MDR7277822.1 putative amidohydrolase YtcJ [Catenuloplanes atrovinosus]